MIALHLSSNATYALKICFYFFKSKNNTKHSIFLKIIIDSRNKDGEYFKYLDSTKLMSVNISAFEQIS